MDVQVLLEGKIRKVKLPAGSTIKTAINAVDANEQTILVKLNGKICHSKSKLSQGDKVELVGIIYGG
ncbi:MAG: MoaD/ThiS family protein [Candidatus Micrarchaeia archaeon]|jgi:sulfur carrier protein ThiS